VTAPTTPTRLGAIESRLAAAEAQLPRPEHASSVGMAMISMHADLAALVAVVKAVRAIHKPDYENRCVEDVEDWPCPTEVALSRLEAPDV